MAARLEILRRPAATVDYTQPSRYRTVGFALGFVGVMLAVVTLIANIVAAGDVGQGADTRETLAWSFGLTTAAFGTIKLGIGTILMGVLIRAWMRAESMKVALPDLKGSGSEAAVATGDIDTEFGPATATSTAPEPLLIHKIAPKAWAPMLAMGVMLVVAGLVLSIVQVGEDNTDDFRTLAAWVQGLQFLGEAMLLGGIAFLLGSILGALRGGGGEVQESLGVTVKTLKMPPSAMAFIALMMAGMMVLMAQFGLYIVAAYTDDPGRLAWFAWLGPLREVGIALLLLSIVLALYTIGTVLAFQFNRIREIVTTGS